MRVDTGSSSKRMGEISLEKTARVGNGGWFSSPVLVAKSGKAFLTLYDPNVLIAMFSNFNIFIKVAKDFGKIEMILAGKV